MYQGRILPLVHIQYVDLRNIQMNRMKKLWFKRKLYGWGWQPASWEGWLVLWLFLVVILGNVLLRYDLDTEPQKNDVLRMVAETFGLVFFLILVYVRTGERPRWQWGKRVEDEEDGDVNAPR